MVKNPIIAASLELSVEMNSNGNSYGILKTQAFNIKPLTNDDITSLNYIFTPVNV